MPDLAEMFGVGDDTPKRQELVTVTLMTPAQLRSLTNQALEKKEKEKRHKEEQFALKEKQEVDFRAQKIIDLIPRLTTEAANDGKDSVILTILANVDIAEAASDQLYISSKTLEAKAARQVQLFCEKIGFQTKITRVNNASNWYNLLIHW